MTNVSLTGQLICSDQEQMAVVEQHLALTRSEPGCIFFEVSPTEDPLIWQVDEQFQDVESVRAHQQRVSKSEWGMATANIDQHYEIRGM